MCFLLFAAKVQIYICLRYVLWKLRDYYVAYRDIRSVDFGGILAFRKVLTAVD